MSSSVTVDSGDTKTGKDVDGSNANSLQDLVARLRSEDVQLRLNTTKRLPVLFGTSTEPPDQLAALFGSLAHDDDDEVLLALAEALEELARVWITADKDARCVLPALESLAGAPEPTVRSRASKTLSALAACTGDMKDNEKKNKTALQDALLKSIVLLSGSDWPTARATAASVVPALWKVVSVDARRQLRTVYANLASDAMMVARKAAVTALPALLASMGSEGAEEDKKKGIVDESDRAMVLKVVSAAVADDQESVRTQVPSVLEALMREKVVCLQHDASEDAETYILSPFFKLSKDYSWRVRLAVADRMPQLCVAAGDPAVAQEYLLPVYLNLGKESEPEVLASVATRIAEVAAAVPKSAQTSELLPLLVSLAQDPCDAVRAAAATAACDMAPLLGHAGCGTLIERVLEPLLQDSCPDVVFNVINKMRTVTDVAGADGISDALVSAIIGLARSPQWRVRTSMVQFIPQLAEILGAQFFDEKLCGICLSWLGDSVFAVRSAAVSCIEKVATMFGGEWAESSVLPAVFGFSGHQSYLCRLSCLDAITALFPILPEVTLNEQVLPVVISMTRDPVANIRFNAVKSLQKMASKLSKETVESLVKPTLESMKQEDIDLDVRKFAEEALLQQKKKDVD